jgi:hypothetical protein
MLSALLALAGCGDPVLESPAPGLTAIDPALLCIDRDTALTVTGSNLVPTPTGVLDAPTLQLPDLSLVDAGGLDGSGGTGRVEPIDETAGAADAVYWVADTTMTFLIPKARTLPEGVYDLEVANADGQTATLPQGIAAVRAPKVDAVDPSHFSHTQGATLALSGVFLQVGATLPSVGIGVFSGYPSALDGCAPLAGPIEGQLCTSLTIDVPAGTSSGDYPIIVTNPAPADCPSLGNVEIQVD